VYTILITNLSLADEKLIKASLSTIFPLLVAPDLNCLGLYKIFFPYRRTSSPLWRIQVLLVGERGPGYPKYPLHQIEGTWWKCDRLLFAQYSETRQCFESSKRRTMIGWCVEVFV